MANSTQVFNSSAQISKTEFLKKLQEEAALQARLHNQRVLPSQLDWLTSLIGRYPWQTVFILSGLIALALEII